MKKLKVVYIPGDLRLLADAVVRKNLGTYSSLLKNKSLQEKRRTSIGRKIHLTLREP